MDTVKLSSKGQIVIPKAIRDDMHLPPGTEFIISATATGLTLTPKTLFPPTTSKDVRGFLAKPGRSAPDDAELKARIKARLRARNDADKE
jgi:AbrB family looped-hinge helix DNA binding protein